MKSKLLALFAAGLLAVSGASAATVTFTAIPGLPRASGGGPFKATTSDLGAFTVFCLERSELVDFGRQKAIRLCHKITIIMSRKMIFHGDNLWKRSVEGKA
mgnify:CR=1 FL=1